jgi:predicted nuclease of restriction endonuclease-like RecB superfamily
VTDIIVPAPAENRRRQELKQIIERADRELRPKMRASTVPIVASKGTDAYVLGIKRLRRGGYRIELSGPAWAPWETGRYGVNFARFVPALLACKGRKMEAKLQTPWGWKAKLAVSDRDGLRSHLPPPEEFDSSVEEGRPRARPSRTATWPPERDHMRKQEREF